MNLGDDWTSLCLHERERKSNDKFINTIETCWGPLGIMLWTSKGLVSFNEKLTENDNDQDGQGMNRFQTLGMC